MGHIKPPPITEAEIAGAEQIRQTISNIPESLNTDFYLARWWRAHGGDLSRIKKHLEKLFEHRRTLGYDCIETELLQTKLEIARKTFERFCISKIALSQNVDNVFVFVQRMVTNDIKDIAKVIPFSYVLHSYFIMQEAFTRAQLEAEKATGSPAVIISILDLSGLIVSDFLNPLSVSARFARLIVKLWADYFTETQVKLFLINPPGLISVMWQVTKLLMDKATLARIEILSQPTDLLKHLSPTLVPAAFGGTMRDDSGYAETPELVCQKPIRIIPQHYYNPDLLWRQYGFPKLPRTHTEFIKGLQTYEIKKICNADSQYLLWHFTVSSDTEFSIVRMEEDGERIVWPRMTLVSLRAPEQGLIRCNRGKYTVRFTNPNNSWLHVKLHYVVELCSDPQQ